MQIKLTKEILELLKDFDEESDPIIAKAVREMAIAAYKKGRQDGYLEYDQELRDADFMCSSEVL